MTRDICVVIPTIRETDCLTAYVENARRHGFETDRLYALVITEDFCDTQSMDRELETLDIAGAVVDTTGRCQWYRDHNIDVFEHLVPEASHAETSFGLLYLWANGFDYGVFIDDDTRPHPETNYFETHLQNLAYTGPITTVESDTQWVNVLYQNVDDHGLYPRGYPYAAMNETRTTTTTIASEIVVSQGLWTNVPDLDAARILMDGDLNGQSTTRTTKDDFGAPFIAAPGNYLTICSMNLAFKREIIPAFYQLPMDDNDWNIGRFDDIWSGVFLKRVCDLLGKQIVTGPPLCEHNKAKRSTFADLQYEAAGLELNEHLWQIMTEIQPSPQSYRDAYADLGRVLEAGDWSDYQNGAFLNTMGSYMLDWVECLSQLSDTARQTPQGPHDAPIPE